MPVKLKFPVGRQRITSGVRPSEARYTGDIASQMDAIVSNVKAVVAEIEVMSADALEYALQPIYDESQELVPVKSGKLKASGFMEIRKGARVTTGIVGYAKGGDPHYAVFVHERMDLKHEAPTQAKFLEEPVNRHIHEVPERYAEYIRNELGTG